MTISAEPIIYGLIFVACLVLVNGIYLVAFGKSINANNKVNRRLEMLEKGGNREEVLEKLRKEMGQHLSSKNIPLYALLADKAQKGNIAFTPSQLIMVMGLVTVMAFAFLTVGTGTSLPIRIAVAIAMGVGGVFLWVHNKAKKRTEMIQEQLPDAVELMVRSLRVGHPFSSAIGVVAKEIPDPLGTEMGVVSDEASYGRDIGETLKHMADRMDLQDMRFLAVAVAIQQTAGGNLADILHGLAQVIRARFRLFRRVKAITAEAKWSGMFLSVFPLGALVMILLIQPGYYDDVRETSVFIPTCLVVAAFLTANIFVMRRLVDIKV